MAKAIEMTRANENSAAFMDDEYALKDRELFVKNLGILLSQTREGVLSCELIDGETAKERVRVVYGNDYAFEINTHLDSYMAIIRDVTRKL